MLNFIRLWPPLNQEEYIREKGKANEQLIELLSKHFKVAKSKIKILKGEKATLKLVEIEVGP